MDTVRLFRQWPSIRFHYGTMEAGKSLQLLIAAHQLKQKDVDYVVLTAVPDHIDVSKSMQVTSRSGLPPHASIGLDTSSLHIYEILQAARHILIDEAQFLTRDQVAQLRELVEVGGKQVDCYGLRTDFQGEFFPGSLELMRSADELIEVPSLCSRCTRAATHNMRIDEVGNAVGFGVQVALKETTQYVAVCHSCWKTAMSRTSRASDESTSS